MPPLRILLTGATGAVGQHLVEALLGLPSCELVLVVRDPARLGRVAHDPRVQVIPCDLSEAHHEVLRVGPVHRAVFAATSWGRDASAVNVDATLRLAAALGGAGVEHLVWFGTASILGADGTARPDAATLGTPYIRSKAACRLGLLAQWPTRLTMVHPTLVVAGGVGWRPSHVGHLIREIDARIGLAQWFTGEGSLHLVHAADLAGLVVQLLTRAPHTAPRELVVGAPPLTLAALLDLLLERHDRRRLASFDLSPGRVDWLVRLLRVRLSAWDRQCLAERHFVYPGACLTLDAAAPRYPTARAVIASIPREG